MEGLGSAYGVGALRPMRIQARKGSPAEAAYYRKALAARMSGRGRAIARGIDPAPMNDLVYHGGKVIPQMAFQNIYLGGLASWDEADVTAIDTTIARAMRDRRLDNVVRQYFPGRALSCDMRASFVLDEAKPVRVSEADVRATMRSVHASGLIRKRDLGETVFNLILPPGTVLELDGDTSLEGLGGFHGSMHLGRGASRVTLYYSANVYSQRSADGAENGIAVFNRPWKNVVATLYHELNEFRTDPDVNDAIESGDDGHLGWTSRDGEEIGDQPIFAAASLELVFREIAAAEGGRRLPVQFLYSNAVHGAEGPIAAPHR